MPHSCTHPDVQHADPVAKVMFVLCSEMLEVRLRFSCRDDAERQDWIKWLMRATEQDFTPQDDSKKGGLVACISVTLPSDTFQLSIRHKNDNCSRDCIGSRNLETRTLPKTVELSLYPNV